MSVIPKHVDAENSEMGSRITRAKTNSRSADLTILIVNSSSSSSNSSTSV